jgi:hypothetical protein
MSERRPFLRRVGRGLRLFHSVKERGLAHRRSIKPRSQTQVFSVEVAAAYLRTVDYMAVSDAHGTVRDVNNVIELAHGRGVHVLRLGECSTSAPMLAIEPARSG